MANDDGGDDNMYLLPNHLNQHKLPMNFFQSNRISDLSNRSAETDNGKRFLTVAQQQVSHYAVSKASCPNLQR